MRLFEAFVAHRYLRTRKKGAFVRVMVRFARFGVALGVFAMVVGMAIANGFQKEIERNLFTATAPFTVAHRLGEIPDTADSLRRIRATPGVVAASPFRLEKGLLKLSDAGTPANPIQVVGIDPSTARQTSSILEQVRPTPVEQLKEGEILLGKGVADAAQIPLGAQVAVIFVRLDVGLSGFQPRLMAFRVVGTFESHISEYDKNWAYIHIDDAKRIAATDQAEMIGVRTQDFKSIDAVKASVLKSLGGAFMTHDLREQNRQLFSAMRLEKWIASALLSLIVLVSAFNIVASLVILVTEKRRDLGALLALGATPRQIERIFELQGLRIAAVGTAWGMAVAIPFCLIADRFKLIMLPEAVYDFLTYLPLKLALGDLCLVAVFPMAVAWLASRYPARRASSVDPVNALRAE